MASSAGNLLLRQFSQGHVSNLITKWWQFAGVKHPRHLNAVIPDITKNLFDSTKGFLDAVYNKDTDFVAQTATLALRNKLVPLMKDLDDQNISIK